MTKCTIRVCVELCHLKTMDQSTWLRFTHLTSHSPSHLWSVPKSFQAKSNRLRAKWFCSLAYKLLQVLKKYCPENCELFFIVGTIEGPLAFIGQSNIEPQNFSWFNPGQNYNTEADLWSQSFRVKCCFEGETLIWKCAFFFLHSCAYFMCSCFQSLIKRLLYCTLEICLTRIRFYYNICVNIWMLIYLNVVTVHSSASLNYMIIIFSLILQANFVPFYKLVQ